MSHSRSISLQSRAIFFFTDISHLSYELRHPFSLVILVFEVIRGTSVVNLVNDYTNSSLYTDRVKISNTWYNAIIIYLLYLITWDTYCPITNCQTRLAGAVIFILRCYFLFVSIGEIGMASSPKDSPLGQITYVWFSTHTSCVLVHLPQRIYISPWHR